MPIINSDYLLTFSKKIGEDHHYAPL